MQTQQTELERLNHSLRIASQKLGIFTKKGMAKFLDYTNPYYSEVTTGRIKLSDDFMKKISDKLNINSDWIKTGNGNIFNEENDEKDNKLSKNDDEVIRSLVKSIERMSETHERDSQSIARLVTIIENNNDIKREDVPANRSKTYTADKLKNAGEQ